MKMRHLALLICAFLIIVLMMATVADAITFSDATAAQEDAVMEALEYGWVDWRWVDAKYDGGVRVIFNPDLYETNGWYGVSWPTCIIFDSDYSITHPYFAQLVRHEWMHQMWRLMDDSWKAKWTRLCTGGSLYYGATWMTDPAENFAECMRVALWNEPYWQAQTELAVISPVHCKVFIRWWQRSLLPPSTPQ